MAINSPWDSFYKTEPLFDQCMKIARRRRWKMTYVIYVVPDGHELNLYDGSRLLATSKHSTKRAAQLVAQIAGATLHGEVV